MERHILQSDLWAKFKNNYGTTCINAGNVWYTKHAIPLTGHYYAYCPRVIPQDVDFVALKKSLEENNCIALHFDVPNVVVGSEEENKAVEILSEHCVKSARDEFAKGNFLLDLTPSEEELFQNLHYKQRYNVRYAQKKGVITRFSDEPTDFDKFYDLYKETATRQKYYPRSKNYLIKVKETFGSTAKFLIAEHEGKPLTGWMLIKYGETLYYPYGGSSETMKNLQSSCLVGWEAIRIGKEWGAKLFDMWGAAVDLNDEKDSYYGFSNFKAKFGGKHVVYIDSYDFIVNTSLYRMFTTANSMRWKLLNFLR
jgi:lipid II:glycine glycyltransferase (peptidoglycan interpeptide bridge formation enzyme)